MNNEDNYIILINRQCRTADIASCQYRESINKYVVVYAKSSKPYHYNRQNVAYLRNPRELNPANYHVRHNGSICSNIVHLYEFTSGFGLYYKIVYASGTVAEYNSRDLELKESCLSDEKSQSILDYFKDVAEANALKGDDNQSLLSKQYQNVDFLENDLAIAPYICPSKYSLKKRNPLNLIFPFPLNLIFPFGCNKSQLKAVQVALENQLSVVQGPPGTGKTQTILNIIANILMRGMTVLVVSNNNSATENVLEKLKKHNLDFLVASLGCNENKQAFLDFQAKGRKFPKEFINWRNEQADQRNFYLTINANINILKEIFEKQTDLAVNRQELSAIMLEQKHFQEEVGELVEECETKATSRHILELLKEYEEQTNNNNSIFDKLRRWLLNFKRRFIYKIDKEYLEGPSDDVIKKTQALFYSLRIKELEQEINAIEEALLNVDADKLTEDLKQDSLTLLKNQLFKKYASQHKPLVLSMDTLNRHADDFLKEFPVVLSTTFSARSSLHNAVYDYLIMDEASQVSVETGVLALTCARNAVIVGDTMQLPNVVTTEDKKKLEAIRTSYDVNEGYNCAENSFLQSVLNIIPKIPQTLLREHYRCAPQIINFCNQKFYGGNLVIMTKEDIHDTSMTAIKTVKGNHSRDHINQREIDVITQEVLPKLNYKKDEIGIITPYNRQVDTISEIIDKEIEVYTVHKFQGREKDAIVMSVVDDQITPFADDPNILNVAVSRAKKKFILVVSGNEQETKGNISDLLGYIQYQHGDIIESNIHSVFDLLYKQYADVRADFLVSHKRVSEYDSENLLYATIQDVIASHPALVHLDVLCHYPMNLLLGDRSALSEEENKYASNRGTHVDFLIYSRVSKQVALAIEVDGWNFHQEGSKQAERDKMKDHIMSTYCIPFIRLSTTGSDEKNKIKTKLLEVINL